MAKLNPNAQLWVDALRSGKYKQCKNALRVNDYYCCLGVLCDVAIKSGVAIEVAVGHFHSPVEYDHSSTYTPKRAMEWIGLNSAQGKFGEANSLARMNDTDATFAQIAEAIEEHAEELGVSA